MRQMVVYAQRVIPMMTMYALVLHVIIDYLTVPFHHMRKLLAQVLVNKCTFYGAPLLVYVLLFMLPRLFVFSIRTYIVIGLHGRTQIRQQYRYLLQPIRVVKTSEVDKIYFLYRTRYEKRAHFARRNSISCLLYDVKLGSISLQ